MEEVKKAVMDGSLGSNPSIDKIDKLIVKKHREERNISKTSRVQVDRKTLNRLRAKYGLATNIKASAKAARKENIENL